MKYKYEISEDSYDTRWFTLETDVKLDDDSDIFWEALGQVDINKEGDSSETEDTESGIKYKVTFDHTEYGDNAETDWNLITEEKTNGE